MSNIFETSAAQRKKEQAAIESGAIEKVERTTLSLSITRQDKEKLRLLAVRNGTTIAGLIHSWIAAQE